jgi:predicted HAD superfamily hydrolase
METLPHLVHKDILNRFEGRAKVASVASFDLFDTLLVRALGRPSDIFAIMSERLAARKISFADRFVQERVQGEKRARENATKAGRGDVTLDEIYAELALALEISSKSNAMDIRLAIEMECELEIAAVNVDEQVKEVFDRLVSEGVHVVLVSDMYLPSKIIDSMLDKSGIKGYSHLFLSNECGASKAQGSIWPYLRDQLGLTPQDLIVHLGDNPEADGSVAERFGILPFLLAEAKSRLPPRQFPAKGHWFHDCCLALLQQSLVRNRDNSAIDPYWLAIAHLIVLPAALGMSGFVRDIADRLKTDRIFFLARDGLIFQKAYEACWRRPGGAKSHYIWGSRRCLNVAMIDAIDDTTLEFLLSGISPLSAEDFVRRLDLDLGDPEVMAVIRARFDNPEHIISSQSDRETMRAILHDLEIKIRTKAKTERTSLLLHLNQVGLFEGPSVLVDLGWHGTMQRSLTIIGQNYAGNPHEIVGVYMGTFSRRSRSLNGRKMRLFGWLFDCDRPAREASVVHTSVEMIELLFSAPEGSIKYLESHNGIVIPVRLVESEEAVRLSISAMIHEAVDLACGKLRLFMEDVPQDVLKSMAIENLEYMLKHPSATDIAKIKNVSHAEGFGAARYRPLIAPRPIPATRWALFNEYRNSFWPKGFLASLGLMDRIKIKIMSKLHSNQI